MDITILSLLADSRVSYRISYNLYCAPYQDQLLSYFHNVIWRLFGRVSTFLKATWALLLWALGKYMLENWAQYTTVDAPCDATLGHIGFWSVPLADLCYSNPEELKIHGKIQNLSGSPHNLVLLSRIVPVCIHDTRTSREYQHSHAFHNFCAILWNCTALSASWQLEYIHSLSLLSLVLVGRLSTSLVTTWALLLWGTGILFLICQICCSNVRPSTNMSSRQTRQTVSGGLLKSFPSDVQM